MLPEKITDIKTLEAFLFRYCVENGEEKDLSIKKHWFVLNIVSIHKEKRIEIISLEPSIKFPKEHFFGTTWGEVFLDIEKAFSTSN